MISGLGNTNRTAVPPYEMILVTSPRGTNEDVILELLGTEVIVGRVVTLEPAVVGACVLDDTNRVLEAVGTTVLEDMEVMETELVVDLGADGEARVELVTPKELERLGEREAKGDDRVGKLVPLRGSDVDV